MSKPIRQDLIHPELSYKIIGILFEVYNKFGPGYHEKYYQSAIAVGFKNNDLDFKEQVYMPLTFQNSKIEVTF